MIGENETKYEARGIARLRSTAIVGLDGAAVDVEVFLRGGQPKFTIIGLGDGAVREAKDRVTSALRHSGFRVPGTILVNLAPAELRKEGSSFDLPIAVAILFASGRIKAKAPKDTFFHGELALDGKLKPVRGVIAASIEALRSGGKEIIVPAANAREASLISGLRVVPVRSLVEVVAYLEGSWSAPEPSLAAEELSAAGRQTDISDVHGQEIAKRAMLIAAAGGHNLLMLGPF